MHRYYSLNVFLRRTFGERVQKVPLDAGFSCPNRDGTLSGSGCAFCNPSGSGSGLSGSMTLAEQWDHWRERLAKRYKVRLFMAYLQSYSNTYGPLERIRTVLDELHGLPSLCAISIGTRPDCLDQQKIDLLADLRERHGVGLVTLELGLQSSRDDTLRHINRGHTAADFETAARMAADAGLNVVAHAVGGLPAPEGRETADDLVATTRFTASLPVHGIKFHNLYVCKGTTVARWWRDGTYEPMSRDEYLDGLGRSLEILRPDMVVHRLHGDPAHDELLAPDWAGDRNATLNAVRAHLETHEIWQAKRNGAQSGPPSTWDPNAKEA
ncbi:TIGR01212 family radical SAM protein [Salidesulfovibrio brasiliensis]